MEKQTKRIERIMKTARSVVDLQAGLNEMYPKMKVTQRERTIREWQYRHRIVRRPRPARMQVTSGGLPSLGKRSR
jgi:transcription elongation GreA/GreB family factor